MTYFVPAATESILSREPSRSGASPGFHRRSARLAVALLLAMAVCHADLAAAATARVPEGFHLECHFGPADGNPSLWNISIEASKRQARRRWRRTVRPILGSDFTEVGWADRNLGRCAPSGYCCKSKKIWGVTWDQCSFSATPCTAIKDVDPRDAETRPQRIPPLQVVETRLRTRIMNPQHCPRRVTLVATFVATGSSGVVEFELLGEPQLKRVKLDIDDFKLRRDGRREATYEFHRVFDRVVDRTYRLKVTQGRLPSLSPRGSRGVRVKVNCLAPPGAAMTPDAMPRD